MKRMNRDELMKLDKSEIITIQLSALAIIEQKSEKNAELEAHLNQNSTNSSKPPSSDVFTKPQSLRKPSGKNPVGNSVTKAAASNSRTTQTSSYPITPLGIIDE
jgi:hypothetical protein